MIALVAVIGFSFVACDNGNMEDDGSQGTAPSITTQTLADGAVGIAYSKTLAAAGDKPITWGLVSGALPAGLNLYDNGTISGTPSTEGQFTFTVKATNTAGSKTKQFSITIAPVGGNPNVDTTALNAVLLEAGTARDGVMSAENASEVPTGRKWTTQSEWDAFDSVYKTAAETKANPASQAAVDTAKTNLQTALNTFNAAKKDGSGAAIKLSGTITVKNNGNFVPYVSIGISTDDWDWVGSVKINSTAENTPWELIIKPFDIPTGITFEITGFDNDKYENGLFNITVDVKRTVFNTDVTDININENLNFITISGTFNLDYNGETVPSVAIQTFLKDGGKIGDVTIVNAGKNTPWSMMITSQAVEAGVTFFVVGFNGPLAWQYEQLFSNWGIDLGVTVKDQNKTGIAINLITVSGTVNVTYKGNPPPIVKIKIDTDSDWLGETELKNPSANASWSFVIPAYTSDTELRFSISGKAEDGETSLFDHWNIVKKIVKNTNVSGIALNFTFIELSGTVSVTYNGSPVPIVDIVFDKDDWFSTRLYNPSSNAPWSYGIPAFTSDTEVGVHIILKDENDEDLKVLWWYDTITVKDTNITGIVLNPGNITDD
jgi:hypothetical protein